jgi:uncharacterized repeat protein (TIGR03803 family)
LSAKGTSTLLNNALLSARFQGSDGADPLAGVVQDPAGNLYGTTEIGGAGNCVGEGGQQGCGTVFKLDRANKETVLYSFTAGADGGLPMGGLVLDAAGDLYGTTYDGGTIEDCGSVGCGTVFKVSRTGHEKVLYSFTGMDGDDGQQPFCTLVRDSAGNLYGTTPYGGTPVNGLTFGTVFKVSAKGRETILYSFQGFLDGGYPSMGLLKDAKGNFYGITSRFGRLQYGTFFEVKAAGKFAVLRSFNQDGGYNTGSPLFMDATGNLYGVLYDGGDYQDFCQGYGCGTVFKFTP